MKGSFPKGAGSIRDAEIQWRIGQERILMANLVFNFERPHYPLMAVITKVSNG